MKKFTKITLCAFLIGVLMLSTFISAFAAVPTQDGTYSVPVTLYHSEKDKESMGNKYFVQTALITVKNGKKTITVVTDEVEGLTFSYYTNGTVEGDTAEAKKVSDVEINGKTYAEGFEFPLVTDNQYVGVKFKAPIMPMSPSARLKIDYSAVKALSVEETTATETTEESSVAAENETEIAKETDGTTISEESKTETAETEPEPISENTQTEAEETEAASSAETNTEEGKTFPVIPAVIAAAVVLAAVIAIIIKKKK